MWKKVNGELVHITDETRERFRTTISRSILENLKEQAEQHNTYVNYMLETGIENVIASGTIKYDRKTRPKDRIHYKTTYNKKLLKSLRDFAEKKGFFINDVIEYSVDFIDIEKAAKKDHRYRVE